jgi:hypothetical protein
MPALPLARRVIVRWILPLRMPLKMISLRLPSRMINRDRTDIRLLGQERDQDRTPDPSTT